MSSAAIHTSAKFANIVAADSVRLTTVGVVRERNRRKRYEGDLC